MNVIVKAYVCGLLSTAWALNDSCVGECQDHDMKSPSLLQMVADDKKQKVPNGREQAVNKNKHKSGSSSMAGAFGTCEVDVVLVLDQSGSIDQAPGAQGALQNAATAFLTALQSDTSNPMVAVITFNSVHQVVQTFTSNVDQAITAINGLPTPGGNTAYSGALTEAMTILQGSTRPPSRRVALLITDGRNSDMPQAASVAGQLRGGARLASVGVGTNVDNAYLQSISDDFFPVANFDATGAPAFVQSLIDVSCLRRRPGNCFETDTLAPCTTPSGVCFQNTRGPTTCNPTTNTCHCSNPDHCIFNVSMPFALNWKVCRDPMENAQNPVEDTPSIVWLGQLLGDIFAGYFGSSSSSSA